MSANSVTLNDEQKRILLHLWTQLCHIHQLCAQDLDEPAEMQR